MKKNNPKLEEFQREIESLHSAAFNWAVMCTSYDRALAEDMLQESYCKALAKWEQHDSTSSLKAWLFTIIRNTCIDHFRKKSRKQDGKKLYLEQAKFYKTSTQQKRLQSANDREKFLEYLKELSPREREVIDLVYYQQLKLKEAAEVMNVQLDSVSGYLKRAKEKLKNLILTPVQPEIGTPAFEKTWTIGLEQFSRKKAS